MVMARVVYRFALVAILAAISASASAGPIGFSFSDVDRNLYRIDLGTGVATAIGEVTGLDPDSDIEGLAFQPGTNILFGYDELTDNLVTIDIVTAVGTVVGNSSAFLIDPGLAFDATGRLFVVGYDPIFDSDDFGELNPMTGTGSYIGDTGRDLRGLAALGTTLYAIDSLENALVLVDSTNGSTTLVGPLGFDVGDVGLDFDIATGILYGVEDDGRIFTVNTATGAGTLLFGPDASREGFESLAILPTAVPEPATLATAILGAAAAIAVRLRRKA